MSINSILEYFERAEEGQKYEEKLASSIKDADDALLTALEVGVVHTAQFAEMSTARKILVNHVNKTLFIAVTRECGDCVACCEKVDIALASGRTVYRVPQSNLRWMQVDYARVIDLDHLKMVAKPFTPVSLTLRKI